MTFLENKNQSNVKSFDEKMTVRPRGTQKIYKNVISNFDKFSKENYDGRDAETVFSEMVLIKDDGIDKIYDVLQGWINFNFNNGIAPSVISMWFSYLKKYLRHLGIKITLDDIKENLEFPKKQEEELYPLQLEEIKTIIEVAKPRKKALYYALLGSAMRIGEAVQIRKKDLDLDTERITINIPASITKLKKSRVTFLSLEAKNAIKSKLEKLSDDDLVWGTNDDVDKSTNTERITFGKYCEKANLGMKYESTGRRKINLHSLRAYFITKISRHDENFAKKIAGQKGYMLQYDRMTTQEKLKLYLEVEPELLIYSSFVKDKEIKKLKEAYEKLQKQNERISELEEKTDLVEKQEEKEKQEKELYQNKVTKLEQDMDEIKTMLRRNEEIEKSQ